MKKGKSSSAVSRPPAENGRSAPQSVALFTIAYYWVPVIAYCLLIFLQSAYPAISQTPDLPYMDKIAHGCIYAVLGFLCFRALRTLPMGNRTLLIFCFSMLLSTLYGISDEIHQLFVVSRTAEIMDAAADMLGSILGAGAAWWWYKKSDA